MSFQFITGVDTTYFANEKAARLGIDPRYKESVYAECQNDDQTSQWKVLRIACQIFPKLSRPSILRTDNLPLSISDIEKPQILLPKTCMKTAFETVRRYEFYPTQIPGLPVIRQEQRRKDLGTYWRNIPELR